MMSTGTISASTHKCCRGIVQDGNGCLYTAFRVVNGTFQSSTNESIQNMVADYIFTREVLDSKGLETKAKYKRVKDCLNEIKKGNLRSGKNELQALAMISKLVIRVLSIKRNMENNDYVEILEYGQHIETSKECVYIVYDDEKNKYGSLCIIKKEEPDEIITIFHPDDQAVRELLVEFIREKLHEHIVIEIDRENTFHAPEQSTKDSRIALVESEGIDSKITSEASANLICVPLSGTVRFQPSVSTDNTNGESRKRARIGNGQTCARKKKNSELMDTDRILSVNLVTVPAVNQELTTVSSVIDSVHEVRMRFEVEPALKFRGRTRGDFKPKKKQNRKGKPSRPGKPRYFADRNNKCVLNLLILASCLSPHAEYRLEIYFITREISGCSYKQPYFKFLILPMGTERFDENPKHVIFTLADLKEYSEEMKQLSLRLVVVQQTNPQLMRVAQPLEIFSSLNNSSAITTTYDDKDEFKNAYHLQDFRFAVTLCKREPGETEFRRCEDMQCISQISTTVKKHKISQK